MSGMCNNKCSKYRASRPFGEGKYANGQKRCNSCNIFIYWEGLWCPCCNKRLRLSPRNGKNKKKFLEDVSRKKEILIHGM